jgi:hypothetical protein
MTLTRPEVIPYTAAAGHLAPDTDIEVRRVLYRKLPQSAAVRCCQVFDKGADVHLQAYQPLL